MSLKFVLLLANSSDPDEMSTPEDCSHLGKQCIP